MREGNHRRLLRQGDGVCLIGHFKQYEFSVKFCGTSNLSGDLEIGGTMGLQWLYVHASNFSDIIAGANPYLCGH